MSGPGVVTVVSRYSPEPLRPQQPASGTQGASPVSSLNTAAAARTSSTGSPSSAISKEMEANQSSLPQPQSADSGAARDQTEGRPGLLGRLAPMDASTRKLLSSAAAEALGLGMICFFGCMGTLGEFHKSAIGLPHMQVALCFGLVVMVAIACFAHVSGAHFNPAVTLLALIMKLVDIKTSLVYLVSQCVGGALGYGLLKALTPDVLLYGPAALSAAAVNATLAGPGPCCTVPHPGLSAAQAVLGELVGTAALLMLCCAVWDPRNAHNTDSGPIKFGLLIAAIAMCLGPYTGASLNPARTLAPAVWEGTWKYHWVYWVGPMSAAVLLGYGWPLLFSPISEPGEADRADVPLTLVSADGKRRSKIAGDDEDGKTGY